MDTQFLDSFVLVVKHGSVAEAARRLNLTSAAVMQRLRALEHELGTALIMRSGRTMLPTQAGWAILPQAQNLLSAVRDMHGIANERTFTGELSLGSISSVLTGIMPPLLSELTTKYPRMRLFITPGMSVDLYRKVCDGQLDAAVIVQPQFTLPKTCEWKTWREEPLVVLVHRGIKEHDAHHILQSQPFIRYDRQQWGGRLADEYLQQHDLRPQDRYELDSLEAIAVLVDRQLGVSLVPDWAPPWPGNLLLTKVPLPEPFEHRRIGLLWRRASPAFTLLMRYYQKPDCSVHKIAAEAGTNYHNRFGIKLLKFRSRPFADKANPRTWYKFDLPAFHPNRWLLLTV